MNFVLICLFLSVTVIFLLGIARTLLMSKISVKLIEKYEHRKNDPKLIDEIFEAANKDILLGRVLKKSHATIKDIENLHAKLMIWGDFRKYNRYVPITSFFNVSTLNYLLKHKNDDAHSLTKKMMNHFHI